MEPGSGIEPLTSSLQEKLVVLVELDIYALNSIYVYTVVDGCPPCKHPVKHPARTYSVVGKRRSHGEGSVYFDETRNRWVGQIWLDGRRRKVSAKTKTDAAAKLGRLLHGDPAERHADLRSTVGIILDDWVANHLPTRDLAPSTLVGHQWAVGLLKKKVGRIKLAELNVGHVERALAEMDLSKASLIKIRATLRQALTWAQRRRAITHNPAAIADMPSQTKQTRQRRALTAAQLADLLEVAEGHPFGALFALSARVGLRPGESAAVCVDALDLASKPPTVAVIRGIQRQRNGAPRLTDDLKTAGARRTIALPADVVGVLRRHIAAQAISDGLLFRSRVGGPVIATTMRNELRALCAVAKIPLVTPNELRHTAATVMANAGILPHQLADILGHRSTRMVDEVYRHRPAVIRGPETL